MFRNYEYYTLIRKPGFTRKPEPFLKPIQTDSSTIDGNVEFVHSQYSCIITSQVSTQFLSPTKLSIIVQF